MIQPPNLGMDHERVLLAYGRADGAASAVRSEVPRNASGRSPAGAERDYLHSAQWVDVEACACGLWPAEDPLQSLEAVEPDGRVRHDHDRTGRAGPGNRDRDDRRDACEGTPDRIEPHGSKGSRGRPIGRAKGGFNSKLHVLADAKGRRIRMFLSAGQTSDYIGARALLPSIPKAAVLLGDRGYDTEWFRNALIEMGISPCIPSRAGRKAPIPYDSDLYRLRHRIENMFARLKDWRRIATRCDRCPILFLSVCASAATAIHWV